MLAYDSSFTASSFRLGIASLGCVYILHVQSFQDSEIPWSRNLAQNFDLSAAVRNSAELPIWCRKANFPWRWGKSSVFERRISIFECRIPLSSAEFTFSECRILGRLTITFSEHRTSIFERRISIFLSRNLYFLSAEFWAVYLELQFWVQNLHFHSQNFYCFVQNLKRSMQIY